MAEKIDYAAIPQTAIRVITSPSAFYRDMPKSGGFVEPLVFVIVMGCIAGIIQTVFNFVLHFSDLGFHGQNHVADHDADFLWRSAALSAPPSFSSSGSLWVRRSPMKRPIDALPIFPRLRPLPH